METKFYKNLGIEIKMLCYRFSFLLFILPSLFCSPVQAQNFHLVKDINTATDGSPRNYNDNLFNFQSDRPFAVLNGVSYFSANDGVNGWGLWRSDGTAAGTYQVKPGISPSNIIVSSGKLFFSGVNSLGPGFWKSDGTDAGTIPVLSSVPAGLGSFEPSSVISMNDVVFFLIDGHNLRDQLWRTDGTEAGTFLVKDFYSPVSDSAFSPLINLTVIKNKLYFSAANFNYVNRLWVSDGTTAGTYLISDSLAEPAQMIARSSDNSDSLVYFTASTAQYGNRSLYVTNGKAGNAAPANGFNAVLAPFSYYSNDLANTGGFYLFRWQPKRRAKQTSEFI